MRISLAPVKRSGLWSRVRRPLLSALLILVAFLLQSVLVRYLRIGNAVPYPMLAVTVCLACGGDELYGTVCGLFSGLLWDCISPEVWGYRALCLAVAGLLVGLAFRHLLRSGFFSALLMCAATGILFIGFYWFFFIAMRGFDGAWLILVYRYIPSVIYTLVVFIPFYFAARVIDH